MKTQTPMSHGTRSRGIPTMYRGRTYRSRIEARWAAFFDLMKWEHEYEPFDLDGYIPDFILLTDHKPMLVEVKYTTKPQGFDLQKIYDAVKARGESFLSEYSGDVLLLGCTIGPSEHWAHMNAVRVGWFYEYGEERQPKYAEIDEAVFNYYGAKPGLIGGWGSYADRITGLYEGDHLVEIESDMVKRIWALAGDVTQYKGVA